MIGKVEPQVGMRCYDVDYKWGVIDYIIPGICVHAKFDNTAQRRYDFSGFHNSNRKLFWGPYKLYEPDYPNDPNFEKKIQIVDKVFDLASFAKNDFKVKHK